eukprot:13076192-Alexandrium_andersonii.AAC.1
MGRRKSRAWHGARSTQLGLDFEESGASSSWLGMGLYHASAYLFLWPRHVGRGHNPCRTACQARIAWRTMAST